MNFNQCTFIGNTGSAPKLLTTGSGKAFAKFRLAVHGYAKDEAQEPLWLTVLVWREDFAKTLSEKLKKGAFYWSPVDLRSGHIPIMIMSSGGIWSLLLIR